MGQIYFPFILWMLLLVACQQENLEVCDTDTNHLKDKVDFHCGVVVDISKLDFSADYEQIVKNQFNSATAENIMKPASLHPAPNIFYWEDADRLAEYCAANSLRLHGHTLIWHQQLPSWMYGFEGSKADWENLLKEHISKIVKHFKGKVASWDVVNEAFNDDGTLRNNIWKQHIGVDYIEKAFTYAHEADPEALLFYNDYSVVINPVKRAAILTYFNQLKAKGIPIDGIGLQMHIFNGFPEDVEISKAFDDIWKNDYWVHVSELDISMNPFSQNMEVAPEKELARQAEKYFYVFKAYDRIPDKYKFGITIWGVGDGDSWIRYYYNRDDHPLLFDDNYQPKAAFCKLISDL